MVEKKAVYPDRIRRIPEHFSWLDHALVRKNRIQGISHPSLALYLFLVTVSDAEGLSYYSDSSIERYLDLDSKMLGYCRRELGNRGLVAYRSPFYQVLPVSGGVR